MIDLDYPALQQTRISSTPFPHLLVPGFVPALSLWKVIQDLPKIAKGGSFPPESLRLGSAAKALLDELQGPTFRTTVADRFELDLADAPTMVTVRGQSREKDGRIHRDSTAKRVTVLLYLNQAAASWTQQEGCLRLLYGPDDLEDYAVEVPPTEGTLLVFPNGPAAWHGHRRFIGQRYVIQLNYMTNDAAARAELRRHRLSAMLKRLTAA